MHGFLAAVALLLRLQTTLAQSSCSIATSSASYAAPSFAPGYTGRIIASGLKRPRSIIFDSKGNLLVVEAGTGITALSLNDAGGSCVGVSKKSTVINDTSLNHGIEFSSDGKTLYASNSDAAMRWAYNPDDLSTSGKTTLVTGMDNDDHTTRTLLLGKKSSNQLLISRGSNENIDQEAASLQSGHSQIRSFDIGSNAKLPYNYTTQGTRIGWGLRNSVGVAEHPVSGGVYSVENSADNIDRSGTDIHLNNPGEELNFHGFLDGKKANPDVTGANYGYPQCYAAWNVSEIPNAGSLRTGQQFQIGANPNDGACSKDTINPSLTFPAHWAPLDIKFNTKGSVAYITSHGSWNRQPPSGYLLYAVPFQTTGLPSAPSNSTSSWATIMSNPDNTACPNKCFRPVGLAWDSKGRLFMTSDSTGEIWIITATNGTGINDLAVPATGTSSGPSSTTSKAAARRMTGESGWAPLYGLVGVVAAVLGSGRIIS